MNCVDHCWCHLCINFSKGRKVRLNVAFSFLKLASGSTNQVCNDCFEMKDINVACQRTKKPAHFVKSTHLDLISVILATFELQNRIYTPPVPFKNHSFNKSCHHGSKYRHFLKIFSYYKDTYKAYSFPSYLNQVYTYIKYPINKSP